MAVQPGGADRDEEQLFLQAVQKIGTTRTFAKPEPEEEPPRRSASSRMRQLKRGTIKITEELDLHGFMKDEALVRLDRFIASAFRRGLKSVLVTGKGTTRKARYSRRRRLLAERGGRGRRRVRPAPRTRK
jgi:DNA-nicking Smr family endonuclease